MTTDGELLAPGERLEEFEIEGELGQGGFGVTYLARDLQLGRRVAVKEYLPRDWGTRQPDGTVGPRTRMDAEDYQWGLKRFLMEAQTLAKFDHPHIMRVHRVLETRGTAYLVTEYVEGPDGEARSLADELKAAGTLSEARVRVLLDALTAGLAPVHEAGLVHRDIKPANIMLRPDGEPVLIDFGAARQTMGLHSKSTALTQVLTPRYAPIEQYSARGHQGPWTDIYSLGAVAYCALTGQAPEDATERVRGDNLAPLRSVAAQPVSPELAATVEAALAVNETDRPQSLQEWRALLAPPVDPPREEGDLDVGVVDQEEERGHRLAWVYGGVACLGIVLAVLVVLRPADSPPADLESGPPAQASSAVTPPADEPTLPEGPPADTGSSLEASSSPRPGATAEATRPPRPSAGSVSAPEPPVRAERPAGAGPSPTADASGAAPEAPAGAARPTGAGPGPTADGSGDVGGDPPGPEIDQLLTDAVEAETTGGLDVALDRYGDVLSRMPGNRMAAAGQERVQARITRIAAQERQREANAAFVAGRYDDARRLFQDAFDLAGSPGAAEGLQRVDNVEALVCTEDATCGTLVIQVQPAAEIVVDDRVLGTATRLELRVPAGRHHVRLETDELELPRTVEVVAGETETFDVDLEQLGFPK